MQEYGEHMGAEVVGQFIKQLGANFLLSTDLRSKAYSWHGVRVMCGKQLTGLSGGSTS